MWNDENGNFEAYGQLIHSLIILDSPTIFIATITESPTVTKAVKSANLDDYLLIAGMVLVFIGIIVLSVYLLRAIRARAKYNVNRNNQTNRQGTNAWACKLFLYFSL